MRVAECLREALWPHRTICLCCGRPSRGGHLCAACEDALEALRIAAPVCQACGHRLEEGRCGVCDGKGVARMRAVWVYEDEARLLVHELKFKSVAVAAQVMAEGMADAARKLLLLPETIVTWPTMPAGRRLERGIDHGALLAAAVGERLSLPVRQLLSRSDEIAVETQVGLNGKERRRRLRGAFSCKEALSGPVLLVDDVLTTGATATACAECLLAAGATDVAVVTAAQTPVNSKERKGSA